MQETKTSLVSISLFNMYDLLGHLKNYVWEATDRQVYKLVGIDFVDINTDTMKGNYKQVKDLLFFCPYSEKERIAHLLKGTGIECSEENGSVFLKPADRVNHLFKLHNCTFPSETTFNQELHLELFSMLTKLSARSETRFAKKKKGSNVKKSKNDFIFISELSGGGIFRALKTEIPRNPSSVSVFYYKERKNTKIAFYEVRGQEILRFFIPYHPKTYGVDYTDVISKEVPNFKPLIEFSTIEIKTKIESGEFRGLGNVYVINEFLIENDFNPENVGLDHKDRIVNIEGEDKFSNLKENRHWKEKNDITPKVIESLYNHREVLWNVIGEDDTEGGDEKEDTYKILNEKGIVPHGFYQEVNEALLSILLFPPQLWSKFIKAYSDSEDSKIQKMEEDALKFLQERQIAFEEAALKVPRFSQYLQSIQSINDASSFISQAKQFISTGKKKWFEQDNIDKEMSYRFRVLRERVFPHVERAFSTVNSIKDRNDAMTFFFKNLDKKNGITREKILPFDARFPQKNGQSDQQSSIETTKDAGDLSNNMS